MLPYSKRWTGREDEVNLFLCALHIDSCRGIDSEWGSGKPQNSVNFGVKNCLQFILNLCSPLKWCLIQYVPASLQKYNFFPSTVQSLLHHTWVTGIPSSFRKQHGSFCKCCTTEKMSFQNLLLLHWILNSRSEITSHNKRFIKVWKGYSVHGASEL